MNVTLFQCLKLNWLSGLYEWVTFEARDEQEARTFVAKSAQYLADTLSRAQVLRPMA